MGINEQWVTSIHISRKQIAILFVLSTYSVILSTCKKVVSICFKENPVKMMKNTFYFMLKARFVLEIIKS